jgi:hypothetical protein
VVTRSNTCRRARKDARAPDRHVAKNRQPRSADPCSIGGQKSATHERLNIKDRPGTDAIVLSIRFLPVSQDCSARIGASS